MKGELRHVTSAMEQSNVKISYPENKLRESSKKVRSIIIIIIIIIIGGVGLCP
jgi:hypothetical protein